MFKEGDLVMILDGAKFKFIQLQPNKLCEILSMDGANKGKTLYQVEHNLRPYSSKTSNGLKKLTAQYESKESEVEDILCKRLDLFNGVK